jgi:hypothetical protein
MAALRELTLRELKKSLPPHYIDWWDNKTDEEKRQSVQHLVDELGSDFSPDPATLIWLLETAGVKL